MQKQTTARLRQEAVSGDGGVLEEREVGYGGRCAVVGGLGRFPRRWLNG